MKKLLLLAFVSALTLSVKAETVNLDIHKLTGVVLYTNEAFSQPGAYDFCLGFESGIEGQDFPLLELDLFMPTTEGLQEGTYTLSADSHILLMTSYSDYSMIYAGYDPYNFVSGTMVLTHNAGSNWTFDFTAIASDGKEYKFNCSGDVEVETNDYDPNGQQGGGEETTGTYKYEPQEKTTMNLTFDEVDLYDGYVKNYNIYSITLDSHKANAQGRFFESELYFITSKNSIPAGTYPISDSGEANTFLASAGCSLTGTSKDYPCYVRTYDETYVYDSWYLMSGNISVAYPSETTIRIEGHATTYNGSTVNFTYEGAMSAGVHSVTVDSQETVAPKEILRGGALRIHHKGKTYDATGVMR